MGIRFFSTYDACSICNSMIYSEIPKLRSELSTQANQKGYRIYSETSSSSEPSIPLQVFFYSTRPYVSHQNMDRSNTYVLKEDVIGRVKARNEIKGIINYQMRNGAEYFFDQNEQYSSLTQIKKNN